MLTPTVGNVQVGHHKGKKVSILPGNQITAFAGDQGQALRFNNLAFINASLAQRVQSPLEYALALASVVYQDFKNTGISEKVNLNTILTFPFGNRHKCCVFEAAMQPRMLDDEHYYVALGIGKLSADPFLRFLVDTFCIKGQPKVTDAVFLAYWTVQHAIDTSSGGVDGPIRISVGEESSNGTLVVRELSPNDYQEHGQAMDSAAQALRNWRDGLSSKIRLTDSLMPQITEVVSSATSKTP